MLPDFYLCGPPGFMQSLYDGLTGLGVRPERLHFESFATGAALRVEPLPVPRTAPGATIDGAVTVRFAKSVVTAEWSRDKGTLLEFAGAQGLAPAFGCRSGICGTCATRLARGAGDYVEERRAARARSCCAARSRARDSGPAANPRSSSISELGGRAPDPAKPPSAAEFRRRALACGRSAAETRLRSDAFAAQKAEG